MTFAPRTTPPLALAALLFLSFAPPTASATGPISAGPAARDKIAPWVLAHTEETGTEAEFIVVLGEQADLSGAERLIGKAAKGRFVYETLWAKAQATQGPLLRWLDDRGLRHQAFYIVNAVMVTGTRAVAEAIAERPEVARLEGNPIIPTIEHVQLTPEESASSSLAPLTPTAIEPGVAYIRAPEVWATGATGQGIVIGGADTGVQWDHPALKAHYRGWNGSSADHNYNWHDSVHSGGGVCGANSPEPCDDYGHGTHTIGSAVGADADDTNQIGVAPGAQFIACRNMNQGDGTPTTYLECMEWFLAPYPLGGTPAQGDPSKAPDITTNSWTCPPGEGCAPGTLQSAVEAQRAAGIMFVAGAGNSGNICSTVNQPPAFYDASYTVGAFGANNGFIANFSSRGPVTVDGSNRVKPDITAPGINVRSSVPGDGYSGSSGTSMATPHVAGVVALLWSAHPSMKNLIPQTENVLNQSAQHVSSTGCGPMGVPNDDYGWGRVDAKSAVDMGPVSVDPTPRGLPSSVWLGPALPNPSRRTNQVRYRLAHDGRVDLAIFTSAGQRVRTLERGSRAAGEHTIRWDGLTERGDHTPAGVYLVVLEAGDEVQSRKMIFLGR